MNKHNKKKNNVSHNVLNLFWHLWFSVNCLCCYLILHHASKHTQVYFSKDHAMLSVESFARAVSLLPLCWKMGELLPYVIYCAYFYCFCFKLWTEFCVVMFCKHKLVELRLLDFSMSKALKWIYGEIFQKYRQEFCP